MDTKTELKDFNELSLETKEESKEVWDEKLQNSGEVWDKKPQNSGEVWDDTNFNPDAFKVIDKKYEEEEKLLSKIDFENDQDRYVFQNLPLTPVQKLELIYSLITEESKHVEVDEELKEKIKKITQKEGDLKKKTQQSVSD